MKSHVLPCLFISSILFGLIQAGHAQVESGLSSGPSLKVAVSQDAIYRISYEALVSQGLLSQAVSSSNIVLLGRKAGMLPYFNTEDIQDGICSLPIQMEDGGDGVFGPGDYFLFFGQSPHVWTYNRDYGFLYQTNKILTSISHSESGMNKSTLIIIIVAVVIFVVMICGFIALYCIRQRKNKKSMISTVEVDPRPLSTVDVF